MTRSSRDPDAYDRIRDDKITEQKPEWYVSPDVIGAGMNARLQEQAARIAELEAWQQSAIHLLGEWDKVFELAGKPGNLGESKAEIMQRWIAAAQERERAYKNALQQISYYANGNATRQA